PVSLETRYRIALEAGQIGSWAWDAATGLIDLDERACEIIGVEPPAKRALHEIEQIVHPQDRAARQARWAQALDPTGTGEFIVEYRLIQPGTGQQRWVAVHAKVDFTAGIAHRALGVVRDVTERRRAEAIFAGIVSIAADAIITIDDQHRITLFNDGAERTFGYARDEVIGQSLDVLLPDNMREAHAAHVRRFGASGTSARQMGERSEIRGRRKSGELFSAEASISHLEVGSENMFTVVLRDVSERKRVEELLAKSNSELEARVSERTRELNAEMQRREQTQAQLVRTQRMEAFGQLTGGVAHDFNNILTVITGNLELLDMRLVDEKDRTLLKRAYDAAEMGARLTARLLTFARRRQYETARLNLNDQIMGMVDLLGRTLGEPIVLDTRFDARIWAVRADPSEIENAILNLAINARDAMPRGGRLIIETANVTVDEGQIGMLNKLPAGDYVRFSVSDNGSGMTPEVLQHALEPFFTTKRPGRGTGLGLSTIYGLSQELGGTVTIYSEVDHGTTVSVYLPRSDGPPVTAAQNHLGQTVPASAGETVLLVEDNHEVRQVTSGRLAELGYHVIDVESGPEAVKALQSGETIDIVFSDIVMAGGMSGFDVAQWVLTNRPTLKILLASGFAEEALRGQEKHLAGLKIMRKPYSRSDLARTLRQILEE
ncbi:MAG: PAS domain S-box protein, partial [Hyphomicrobiaceae bacterium]